MFNPTSFKLNKFAWWEPPFTSSIRCQEMSVTVDTAKYTQFYTLQRLCTFTKGPNQPKLSSYSIRWWGKGRRLRRDFLEVVFPWFTPENTVPPITIHLQISGSRSTSSYSVKTEPIWPLVARIASSLGETSVPLFLGGHPQVWFLG